MKPAILIALCLGLVVSAQGRRETTVVAAREAFAKAEALKSTDPERAAALYRASIDSDPGLVPAHDGFILAMKRWKMGPEPPEPPPDPKGPRNGKGVLIYFAPKTRAIPLGGGAASAELKAAYTAWLAAAPSSPALHWGLGVSTLNVDRAAAEAEFRTALSLDPHFSPAYRSLALLAQLNRDTTARAEFLKQAVDADPTDDQSVLEYSEVIPEAARASMLWTVVNRSTGTTEAYSALLKLSSVAASPAEKLPVYRRMWTDFPSLQSYSHCWSMKTLFTLTTGADPATALAVARRFDDVCVGDPDWPDLLAYQLKFNDAKALVDARDFAKARAALATFAPPRSTDGVPYYLLRADAEGAGNPAAGYASLLSAAAKEPRDVLNKALVAAGEKLGKSVAQVDDEVWSTLTAAAKPFKTFSLARYDTGEKISLESLKGKVVLVNFWFPTCGPCMNEFPYIQQAYDKYKAKGFEIIAVNIVSSEDGQALPTMKEKKVNFIGVKMPDPEFAAREYRIAGAPTHFLLDKQGRVIYKPAIHDRETARTFELEIELLLKR